MNKQRKSFLVDCQVQLHIAARVAIYWCAAVIFVILPLAFVRTFTGDGGFFAANILEVSSEYWPVFLMMFLFLPFAVYDSIKVSNRFAGPIYRLRNELKRRESGEVVGPIKFREGDYYSDLPASINTLIAQIDDLEAKASGQLRVEGSQESASTSNA